MMFKKDLIDKILNGSKTMTSRDKPLYKVGAVTNLMANKDYSKATGKYIKLTAVYDKALGKFTDEDSRKEGFKNIAEFRKYWEENIGVWNPDRTVWVHEFILVGLNFAANTNRMNQDSILPIQKSIKLKTNIQGHMRYYCNFCKQTITYGEFTYSIRHFDKPLCRSCQAEAEEKVSAAPQKRALRRTSRIEFGGNKPKNNVQSDTY